ncbi:MAG: hypothetical protein ABSF14_18100 [Terriglobia bacterium]
MLSEVVDAQGEASSFIVPDPSSPRVVDDELLADRVGALRVDKGQ